MEILKYLINVNQPSSNNLCILFTLWRPQTVALQRWQKSYNWLTFDKLGNCRPVEHLCQCYAHPAKGPTFWSKSLSAVPSSSALYHKKFRNCRSDPQNTGVTEIPFTGQVPSFLLRTCCTSTKTSNGCPQGNQLHQLCKVCFQSDIIWYHLFLQAWSLPSIQAGNLQTSAIVQPYPSSSEWSQAFGRPGRNERSKMVQNICNIL